MPIQAERKREKKGGSLQNPGRSLSHKKGEEIIPGAWERGKEKIITRKGRFRSFDWERKGTKTRMFPGWFGKEKKKKTRTAGTSADLKPSPQADREKRMSRTTSYEEKEFHDVSNCREG